MLVHLFSILNTLLRLSYIKIKKLKNFSVLMQSDMTQKFQKKRNASK